MDAEVGCPRHLRNYGGEEIAMWGIVVWKVKRVVVFDRFIVGEACSEFACQPL